MAGALPESGGSGRRSLNTEVNLVPFIDLLSVCICFLLMTAVWIQLGVLDVKQTFGTSGASEPILELELKFSSPTAVELVLKKGAKVQQKVTVAAATAEALPEKLRAEVRSLTEKQGLPKAAVIQTNRSVVHGEVVAVMDVLRKEKISSLGMSVAPMEI